MWRLVDGGWAMSGLKNPATVMSKDFRRCLDDLIDRDEGAVVEAIRQAERRFLAAESRFTPDPAVEEQFKHVRPPTPLLIPPVNSADNVRDSILHVDPRWQPDAMAALDDYIETRLIARKLGACWERSKPDRGQVDVSISSVERAWRKTGFDDFWLRLWTDETDLRVVAEAVSEADQTADRQGIEATRSMLLEQSPDGFAVMVGPTPEPQLICDWIAHFVESLGRRGVAGRVSGVARR